MVWLSFPERSIVKDFASYDLRQIEQLISNYRAKGAVHVEDFAALLQARDEKLQMASGLNLHRSLERLKQAALAGGFISYGELAAASGLAWTHTLRARMSGPKGHLDQLLDHCDNQQLPLLPSLCVNKQNLTTGALDHPSLKGFAAGARRIGLDVVDEEVFLRQCQEACFDWGRRQRPA